MIEETLAHSAEDLLFTPFVSVTRRTGERRTAYFPLSSLSSPSSILDPTWTGGGGGGGLGQKMGPIRGIRFHCRLMFCLASSLKCT